MQLIDAIGNEAKQSLTVIEEVSGREIKLTLKYRPTQESWYYDIESGDFITRGNKLCSHPNILRQFKNNINFGMGVVTIDGTDPFYINDFALERVKLYILSESDVETVEGVVFG
jgi:hypothetical protein